MISGLVDHLWQSCCCCGLTWIFATMTRGNAALIRLWLWRIAALKLLLPFSLLFALGEWLGYPTTHSADPSPPGLVAASHAATPYLAPAKYFGLAGFSAVAFAALALAAASTWCWRIVQRLRREARRVDEQAQRRELDPDDKLPSIGFFRAALFTAFASVAVSAPLLAGAIANHQWRLKVLIANSLALRNAPAEIRPAAPGMGMRYRVDANTDGISIRNVSIHDLVAIVYGVNRYWVITTQMISESDPSSRSWMHWPRYDVRIEAPVPHPQDFDPYALRQNLTKLLADRFGLEIYVGRDCQPPCGVYQLPLATDPL